MDLQKLVIQQKPIERKYSIEQCSGWWVFSLIGRVDSFNFENVKTSLLELVSKNPKDFAVNLQSADFLSIPFIKLLAQIADELKAQDTRLALIAPSEKLKRQIDIFASLDEMVVFRSTQHLTSKDSL